MVFNLKYKSIIFLYKTKTNFNMLYEEDYKINKK